MKAVDNDSGMIEEDDLTLDKMLLYIRGGTVFGRKDIARRSSSAMKYDPYTVVIAVDSNGEARGSLYIDDGDSFDYKEKLAFARIQFNAKLNAEDKVLSLKLDVVGRSSLLPRNLLSANKIVLITPSGFKELPIELYLGNSESYELKL